ncbi:MalY/PatB family protein [Dellaglioa sp. BT-FLS60]
MSQFDKMTNRFDTDSMKWDVQEGELPMWVADMDFEVAPEIQQAITDRLAKPALGYTDVPERYYEAVANWWETKHQFKMETDWILFSTGVVPAISSIVRKMTQVNDNVVVLSPVYNIFYNSIINNQRHVLVSEFIFENENYRIDYQDLEEKLARPETTLFIFCNPHNPIGKVWDRETLLKVGNLCLKYDVLLLSDEIHCDLTHPGYAYTPFASVSAEIAQNVIMCAAPTKTFNIAGMQTASIIVPNPKIRALVNRGINTDEVAEPNVFAIEVAIAAFTKGDAWLRELLDYLMLNKAYLESFMRKNVPQVKVIHAEATYLAWLDCTEVTEDTTELCDFIRKETGLYLSAGDIFGKNGRQFIRLNYACPKARLEDGLARFERGITSYLQK